MQCVWRWSRTRRRVRRREMQRLLAWQEKVRAATVRIQAFARGRQAVALLQRSKAGAVTLQVRQCGWLLVVLPAVVMPQVSAFMCACVCGGGGGHRR